jgi:hypothetical protein
MLALINPCNELLHVFNTTFLTKKDALITMEQLVLRVHAACMSGTNLGAYVEVFSARTGTYISSSSYKPRLARASLRFNKM